MPTRPELRQANTLAWDKGKGIYIFSIFALKNKIKLNNHYYYRKWICFYFSSFLNCLFILNIDASQYKNLDSNIKKNTAFIKKCKTSLAADSTQQLLNDIKKLSLEKYISEIVGAVLEGMLKCKSTTDISACVEVCIYNKQLNLDNNDKQ